MFHWITTFPFMMYYNQKKVVNVGSGERQASSSKVCEAGDEGIESDEEINTLKKRGHQKENESWISQGFVKSSKSA